MSDHQVIKTLVFETDQKKPLLVLMHGDREVSTKQMARIIGAKQVTPCDASTAQRTLVINLVVQVVWNSASIPVYCRKSISGFAKNLYQRRKTRFHC